MTDQKESDVTCTDCYAILAEIKAEMKTAREYQQAYTTNQQASNNKIMIMMLGIIAANIGVKFIGTPWYIHMGVYVALVASVFLLSSVVLGWRRINWRKKVLMLAYSSSVLYATALRIYHYQAGTNLTKFEGFFMNLAYTFVSMMFIVAFWNSNYWNGKERRRNPC